MSDDEPTVEDIKQVLNAISEGMADVARLRYYIVNYEHINNETLKEALEHSVELNESMLNLMKISWDAKALSVFEPEDYRF